MPSQTFTLNVVDGLDMPFGERLLSTYLSSSSGNVASPHAHPKNNRKTRTKSQTRMEIASMNRKEEGEIQKGDADSRF
jgi:hypothetical protein